MIRKLFCFLLALAMLFSVTVFAENSTDSAPPDGFGNGNPPDGFNGGKPPEGAPPDGFGGGNPPDGTPPDGFGGGNPPDGTPPDGFGPKPPSSPAGSFRPMRLMRVR